MITWSLCFIHLSLCGGSPTFKDEAAIEGLYRDLEALFTWLSDKTVGMTLAEFYQYKINAAQRALSSALSGLRKGCTQGKQGNKEDQGF